MYAGLAIQGDVKVLIRGFGKGLVAQGVAGALDDAMITVRYVLQFNLNHFRCAKLTEAKQDESLDPNLLRNSMKWIYNEL